MKTKELIQELVGLCVEKQLNFEYVPNDSVYIVYKENKKPHQFKSKKRIVVFIKEDANQQLQNAITEINKL